ncbi:serine hydrolase [Namhaeicola litoreus]|uniref:beta-lactamase n=1 Tax=Namhaeicola litoreus TaxID=1052145 RepID=A0ABW3Y068_9FLAO
MKKAIILLGICLAIASSFAFYPIDGYGSTKIARLLQLQRSVEKGEKMTRIPPGAMHSLASIKLNLKSVQSTGLDAILTEDPDFSAKIKSVIPQGNYSLVALDMSDPDKMKYAAYKEDVGYQPGSVGKLAVLIGFFTELKKVYPDSWEKKIELLKNRRVSARYWGTGDHHTIPVYDIESDKLTRRKVQASDVFSLYEWLDHMVSVSNNGAASVVFREAILMRQFGQAYPSLTDDAAEKYFDSVSKDSLTNVAHDVVNSPLNNMGISNDEWRLGGMFTTASGKHVGRKGGSNASPKGLMKFLVQLEQGNVVDENSSLEMKRILYLTDRRIRYAKSPKLDDAAVYYKSGSYYKCDRDKNPNCGDYQGNVFNYMNSVIIVEQPNGIKYIVCLMSNVLNKNSANDHYYMAGEIDGIINKKDT